MVVTPGSATDDTHEPDVSDTSGAAGGPPTRESDAGENPPHGGLDPITAALLDRVNPVGQGSDGRSSSASDGDSSRGPGGVRLLSSDGPSDAPAQDFKSIVRQRALDAVRAHAESQPDIEVCGVLVGTLYENPSSSFVYIDDVIRGDHSTGRGTHVTFTAETWQHIDREMDDKHPGKRIVGWYHSHPGFGIFLSEMDLFIQRHFFNAPWQTALVYDPKSKERGLFAWRDGDTQRVEFVVDDGHGSMMAEGDAAAGVGAPGAEADLAHLPPGSISDVIVRIQQVEQRQRWILAACGMLALVAVIWPLVVFVVIAPMERAAGPALSTQPAPPAAQDFPKLPEVPSSTMRTQSMQEPTATLTTLPTVPASAPAIAPATVPAAIPTTLPSTSPPAANDR